MRQYKNGNALVTIKKDGTRIVEYPYKHNSLKLEYPLNIDIRLSNRCPLGYNPITQQESKTCAFCHESATTNGDVCDFDKLKAILNEIPENMAIELAIGLNDISDETGIFDFFQWCHGRGLIINTTINQLSIATKKSDASKILKLIDNGIISGLGISFRNLDKFNHPTLQQLIQYENTVVHVINGIDNFNDILKLKDFNVKKILVLGEKNFGFNTAMFNDINHKNNRQYWFDNFYKLLEQGLIISFDNLGLEQLDVKRFVKNEQYWNTMYQGEHSFYINAVEQYFSPSSRSATKVYFDEPMATIKQFFHYCENVNLNKD